MKYPIDAIEALVGEVEHQHGALLPEPCVRQDVRYAKPPYIHNRLAKRVTCGCGNVYRFMIPYKSQSSSDGTGFVKVCAVCDNVGVWPRYCDVVYEVDPMLNPSYSDDDEYSEEFDEYDEDVEDDD